MRIILPIVLLLIAIFISACVTVQTSRQSPHVSVNTNVCDWAGSQTTFGDSSFTAMMLLPVAVYCSFTGQWSVTGHSSGSGPAGAGVPSTVQGEHYAAKDSAFGVDAPYEYGSDAYMQMQVSDQSSISGDYVSFTSALEPGAFYSVMTFNPESGRSQLSGPLEDFARSFVVEQRRQGRKAGVMDLQETYAETVNLNGQPVLFRAYRVVPAGQLQGQSASGRQTAYYLLYFFRTLNGRGVIWIAYPGSCSACAVGPESAIRAIDPRITRFVDSFQLGG